LSKKWRYLWVFGTIVTVSLVSLVINAVSVSYSSRNLIFDDCNKIPKVEFGLLLGTPKYLPNGNINHYYKSRIGAVLKLYRRGKIESVIISGSVLDKYGENEIELMRSDLIQGGIDNAHLISDENGNCTLDSIINAKKILQGERVVIVSQSFQLERALYIARREGMDVVGFSAKGKISKKLLVREFLARLKMRVDLILNR